MADASRKRHPEIVLVNGRPRPYPAASSTGVSAVMRGNRKTDTRQVFALRRALDAVGRRYRVNPVVTVGEYKVRPDLVFGAARVAVFVDGCFWHGCPIHGTTPRSNRSYWSAKIAGNIARDKRTTSILRAAGWRVIRIWEHERVNKSIHRVGAALDRRRRNPQGSRGGSNLNPQS